MYRKSVNNTSIENVVASRPDGLGTRLSALIYGKVFSENIRAKYYYRWPSMKDKDYNFGRGLLQSDTLSDLFQSTRLFGDSDDCGLIEDNYEKDLGPVCHIHNFAQGNWTIDPPTLANGLLPFKTVIYDAAQQLHIGESQKEANFLRAKQLWCRMPFNIDVEKSLISFDAKYPLSESLVIHARRGDMPTMITTCTLDFLIARGATIVFQRYFPLRTIVSYLNNEYLGEKRLIVCSENDSVYKTIKTAFPRREIVTTSGIFEPDTNQQALLDLRVMANSHTLLAPFKSFYSEFAGHVGNCRLQQSRLDLPAIASELAAFIDNAGVSDSDQRKAVVFALVSANMRAADQANESEAYLTKALFLDKEITARVCNL